MELGQWIGIVFLHWPSIGGTIKSVLYIQYATTRLKLALSRSSGYFLISEPDREVQSRRLCWISYVMHRNNSVMPSNSIAIDEAMNPIRRPVLRHLQDALQSQLNRGSSSTAEEITAVAGISTPHRPDPVPHILTLTSTGDGVYHLLRKLPHTQKWVAYLDSFYTTLPL